MIAFALLMIGSIVSSGAGQATSNDYPYDTPIVVFGDNNGGNGIPMPATAVSQDQPPLSFVPATFPSVDPLVPTGRLSQARADHTATLLPDGRVIVAGGASVSSDSQSALTSIESYDPKTHSFKPAGHLLTARSNHTATLLRDGTVLFAGGKGRDGQALASAEIYDPTTGKSHPTGDMPVARASASAVALDDGTVLVVGGTDGDAVWSTEIYDPSSGDFKELDHALANDGIVTVVKLRDGSVLVAGGYIAGAWPNGIEIYGPIGNADLTTGVLARDGATSCLLADGRALIVGGLGTSGEVETTAEIFDATAGVNQSLVSLGAPRWRNTTTALPDGSALIVGGSNDMTDPIATVERYYPGSSSTVPVGTMAEARSEHTATLLADGSVLIVGGWSSSATALADAGIFFPNGGSPAAQTQSAQP